MRGFLPFGLIVLSLFAQASPHPADSTEILLSNAKIQIESTQAVNDMYNFKFESAEIQFRWLLQKYPDHPLPYFLLGLSDWWKIMPNLEDQAWDESFIGYMDVAIEKAEQLYEVPESALEASFFLAACHGMKGRLYSERGNWGKAANNARLAMKYQRESENFHYLSPEFLFGDALYNYYTVWIRENYPLLRPIMIAFPKGDKETGIDQLRTVAGNAFYTRIEAQLFLMRILAVEENRPNSALQIAEYLNKNYPDNPYFHRYYARLLYTTGRQQKLEEVCLDILIKIDRGVVGYEANSGRYASFFLGELYRMRGITHESKRYYQEVVAFAGEIDAFETGYYLYSLFNLAKIADADGEYDLAESYLDNLKANSKRKHPVNKAARAYEKRRKEILKSQLTKHDLITRNLS